MTPERFQVIERVFNAACEIVASERAAYLDSTCAGDDELRSAVEAMLLQDDQTGLDSDANRPGQITHKIFQMTADATAAEQDDELPDRIGAYRIVRRIGRGGMGVVFEAEQERPRRRVALKLIGAAFARRQLLRRFELEVKVLGSLQHPGIAQIFEAASALVGGVDQPYLAMEFVEGVPITEFVRREDFGIRAILAIFCKLCEAVQYAHQKGVIHRDLKPANILVTTSGEPKVLDFGVARVTESDMQVTTQRTDVGQLIGTLQYMSPEQAAADSNLLDTRSDVYALGVLLFESLTGQPPYDLRGRSIPDAALIIREQPPTNPSSINRTLRGDIETIVLKAMAKERDRRYASAEALASDIQRYLDDEPVVARPPATLYQIRKFAARNKGLAWGMAVAFVALLAGTVVAWIGLIMAQGQRDAAIIAQAAEQTQRQEAEQQAAIAEAVNRFLKDDLLTAVDPGRTANRDITMREVVDIAAESIDGRFPDAPLVEASILETLSTVYGRLGDPVKAEAHRRRVIDIYDSIHGAAHSKTIYARNSLTKYFLDQGRLDDAVALAKVNLAAAEDMDSPDEVLMAYIKNNLAGAYLELGRLADAAPLLRDSLAVKRKTQGDRDESTLTSINNLAGLYYSFGQFEEAAALYKEAFEVRQEVIGEGDPRTLTTAASYALTLSHMKRFDDARMLIEASLTTAKSHLGDDHRVTLRLMSRLALVLRSQGLLDEAAAMFQETVELQATQLGPENLKTLHTFVNLAELYVEQGKCEEAIGHFETVVTSGDASLPANHWLRAIALAGQATCFVKASDYNRAATVLKKAISMVEASLGGHHERAKKLYGQLADVYDKWDAAEPTQGHGAKSAHWRAKIAPSTDTP